MGRAHSPRSPGSCLGASQRRGTKGPGTSQLPTPPADGTGPPHTDSQISSAAATYRAPAPLALDTPAAPAPGAGCRLPLLPNLTLPPAGTPWAQQPGLLPPARSQCPRVDSPLLFA